MLTDTKAGAAKPKEGPYKLADRDGLYLFITPAGSKSWRYDYRLAGARETLVIGLYPDKSLKAARKDLAKARELVASGVSPAKVKKAQKIEKRDARLNTVRAFGEKWFDDRKASRSESWKDNARRWLDKDIYPAIGNKPIREVTTTDVAGLMRAVAAKRGSRSALYVRLTLASIFKSLDPALNAGNPARDVGAVIEVPKPTPKGRPMAPKDIPAFLEAVDAYPARPETKLALRLLMLTFTRKRELIEAPWSEIDLERGQFLIAPDRMKMDKPHIVPLSRQAIACFQRLKALAGNSPYVFPNLGDPKRPMSASTLNVLIDRVGYGGRFTPHSARSTASTILNSQGWPADAIELQLAHTERNLVRAAYNHADRMEERERMMQAWADYLDGIASGAKVLNIRRAS